MMPRHEAPGFLLFRSLPWNFHLPGFIDSTSLSTTTYFTARKGAPRSFFWEGQVWCQCIYLSIKFLGDWIHITYLIKILIPNHESKKLLLNEHPTVDGSKFPLTSWYGQNYPIILQWYFTSQMVSRISSINSTIHNHQPHLLLPSLHQFLDQRLPRPWAFKSTDRRP